MDSSQHEIDIRTGRVSSALGLEGWGARTIGGYVQVAIERNENVRQKCWRCLPQPRPLLYLAGRWPLGLTLLRCCHPCPLPLSDDSHRMLAPD